MSDDSNRFRFLQVSDVHLDSKMSSPKLSLSATKRKERNQESLDLLVRACDMARANERSVDALLIVGNLFEMDSVTTSTMSRIVELFASLGDIPVVISPGREDYWALDSLYNNKPLVGRGVKAWSPNVHIFTTNDFSVFHHPHRNDVAFTGRACQSNRVSNTRWMANPLPKANERRINVLLYNGTLDSLAEEGQPVHAPFSVAELAAQQFNYAALGNYGNYIEVCGDQEQLLGAYSGTVVGRRLEEGGPRHVILGELTPFPSGRMRLDVEKVPVEAKQIMMATCSINGVRPGNIKDNIRKAIELGGARPGDLVYVKVTGTYPAGAEFELVDTRTQDEYYQLVIENRSRPDYLSERIDERTTEGKFVAVLKDLKAKAESKGGTLTGTEYGALHTRTIEDALYYGLDALKRKKVALRDAD